MSIKYGAYTEIKHVTVPYPLAFNYTSEGNGGGVTRMQLKVSSNMILTISGAGRFYTDSGGTLNASTTFNVATGGDLIYGRTFYFKSNGDSGVISCNNKQLNNFEAYKYDSSNSPSLSADISNWVNIVRWVESSTFYFSGSLTKLIHLVAISSPSGTWTGDVSDNTVLEQINIKEPDNPLNNWTGNLANKLNLKYIEVGGYCTPYGDLSLLTELYLIVTYSYYQQFTVTLDGLPKIAYVEQKNFLGTNRTVFSVNRLINCPKICFINLNTIFASEQTNQLLADLVSLKDFPRDFDYRTVNIKGTPTGQGLIDKAYLQSYRTPNNDPAKPLWVVTTN